jgi:stage V sporulation protein AF
MDYSQKTNKRLSNNINENYLVIDELLNMKKNFDINSRELIIRNKKVIMFYVNSLISTDVVVEINNTLIRCTNDEYACNLYELIYNNIPHQDIDRVNDLDRVLLDILSGKLCFLLEDEAYALLLDTRSYPQRAVDEPTGESIVRGSHDGFVENIITNVALMRRRIRDVRFRNEILEISKDTPTLVDIMYIDGLVDEEALKMIKEKLNNIKPNRLLMTDRTMEVMLTNTSFYPLARHSCRPDILASHLYRGKIVILIDNSPNALILPTTFWDNMTSLEDHSQTFVSSLFFKLIRSVGILISLFLMPIWYLVCMREIPIPESMQSIIPDDTSIIFFEILVGELAIELIRVSSLHTPSALNSSLGLISAVLVGNIAIETGILEDETLLLLCFSSVGNYLTPSYEMGIANKIFKIIFILSCLLGIWGFVIACVLWLVYLSSLKSLNKHYMYPLIPFNFRKIWEYLIRRKGGEING